MRLPVSMWQKTLAALGFRRVNRSGKNRLRRQFQIELLERRELLTAAPLLDSTPITVQLERSGGELNLAQLVAGMTTYNDEQGVAIVGADLSHGALQYSTNGGTSWSDVGAVSQASALLLSVDTDTELRFNRTDSFLGTLNNAITIRAWDQDTGSDGSSVDTTTNGGTTAFSGNIANVSIDITPLVGSPISVASSNASYDDPPALLTALDGQGVGAVAWTDSDDNLQAQLYDASGNPIGSSFQVNTSGTTVATTYPPVLAASSNGFTFAWEDTDGNLLAQRFDDTGTLIDSSPVSVASSFDGYFAMGSTASGGMVLAYATDSSDASEQLIQVQQYAADGTTGSVMTVGSVSYDVATVGSLQLSVATNGDFAVEWMTVANSDGTQQLWASQCAAGAISSGDPIDIASWPDDFVITQPTITMDNAGGFLAAWMQYDSDTGLEDLMARHFDSLGDASDAFLISNTAVANGSYAARFPANALANSVGYWGIVWLTNDGTLLSRFYDPNDEPLADTLQIASGGSNQLGASVGLAANSQGKFLAAWSVKSLGDGESHNYDFYAQRLQIDLPPIVATLPDVTVDTTNSGAIIQLSNYFNDTGNPSGTALTFSATPSDPSVVTTNVVDNQLVLNFPGGVPASAEVAIASTDVAGNASTGILTVHIGDGAAHMAPTVNSTPFTEDLPRGGGILDFKQLVNVVSTFNSGLQGIAITQTSLFHGTLQYTTNYSTDGDPTWIDVPLGLSLSDALPLAFNPSTALRFVPSDSYIGTVDGDTNGGISFLGWDQSVGTNGQTINPGSDGGTAFSSDEAQASIDITPMIGSAVSVPSVSPVGPNSQVVDAINNSGVRVVAWTTAANNLVAQLYANDGTALSFTVNTDSNAVTYKMPIMVSASSNGTFVFGWIQGASLKVRRFDSEGTPIDSTPISITLASGSNLFAALTATPDGGFDVAYSVLSSDHTDNLMKWQHYDETGGTTSDPIDVTSVGASTANITSLQIQRDATNGDVVVQWSTQGRSIVNSGLYARQFPTVGDASDVIPIVSSTAYPITSPNLTLDGSGGFISTWDQDTPDFPFAILAAHYSGGTLAPQVHVATWAATNGPLWTGNFAFVNDSVTPTLSGAPEADWGVIWTDRNSGHLMAQFYNLADDKIGSAFQVSVGDAVRTGKYFSLASNANGNLLASWKDNSNDIYAQAMELNQPPSIKIALPPVVADEGASPTTIDLQSYFADADIPYGDSLHFAVDSGDPSIVEPSRIGSLLTLSYWGTAMSSTNISVTATDSLGNSITADFSATIVPPPILATTPVALNVSLGSGALSMSQLLAGVTTYSGLQGIAITQTNLSHGKLQYSTDNGTTWTNVGAVSDSQALLLASSAKLRFVSDDSFLGSMDDAITFRAWDQTNGANGEYFDTTADEGGGGLSSATAQASIDVTPLIGSVIPVGSQNVGGNNALVTAIDGNGMGVVAWQDTAFSIHAQFYSASGVPIGAPVMVPDSDGATSLSVSANANGTFAFAWLGDSGVEVVRYQDADGISPPTCLDDSPLTVASSDGPVGPDGIFVDVGVTEDGGLEVAYSELSEDSSQYLLQVQPVDSSGNVVSSGLITAASIDTNSDSFGGAQLSVAPDGSFALAWLMTANNNNASLQAIQYNAAGAPVHASVNIANSLSGTQLTAPTISVDGNGGFVVIWMQNGGGANSILKASHYDSTGTLIRSFTIDSSANDQAGNAVPGLAPQSSVDANGNWGVIWTSSVTGNLMGRFYDATDDPMGNAFEINSGSSGSGPFGLATNAQGQSLAAWASVPSEGESLTSYYAQPLQIGPAAPTGLTATVVDGNQVNLTWIGSSDFGTGISIQQWIDGQWQEIQLVDADTESAVVTGTFDPGQDYLFRVEAYNEDSDSYSPPSNQATVTTLDWPAAPTGLTTMAVSNTEIDLTWTDGVTSADGYTVERSSDGVTWTLLTTTPLSPGTQLYDDTEGLADGTMYEYRVQAVNATGGSGYATNAAATLPTAPNDLQATVASGTRIDLSWTAAPDATGYTIWEQAEGSGTWELVTNTVPPSQTTYPVTDLTAGGADYAFLVEPTNSTADSAVASLEAETQNLAPTISAPTAATTTVTSTNTTLSASADDDGGESNLSYTWSVESAPSGGDAYFSLNDSNDAKNTSVTFYAAGNYTLQVTATDALGLTATSTVDVTVQQTFTSIDVTPGNAGVLAGSTRQFAATALDQFGNDMTDQPSFTWAVVGGVGSINSSSGLYTAPASGDDLMFNVSAASGGKTGLANINFEKTGFETHTVIGFESQDSFQNSQVTFSGFLDRYPNAYGGSGSYSLWTSYVPLTVDFTSPVNNLTFEQGADDVSGVVATVQVYSNGVLAGTQNVIGDGNPNDSGLVDLTSYHDITRIVVNTTEGNGAYNGLTWDDFTFDSTVAPRLVELNIADDANPTNTVTDVTDQAIQDLYLPEDETTESASIDISSLLSVDTIDVKKETHLSITRNDGEVIFNGTLDQLTSDVEELDVTADASDFTIKEWLALNDEGGEETDKKQVDVHVVAPWSALKDTSGKIIPWTMKTAMVKANADDASLADLAESITGVRSDASLLSAPEKINKGEEIDVTPLLNKLIQNVAKATSDATTSGNRTMRIDPLPGGNYYFGTMDHNDPDYDLNMKQAAVEKIFNGTAPANQSFNCLGMAAVELTEGLIQGANLKPGELDKLVIPATETQPAITGVTPLLFTDNFQGNLLVQYPAKAPLSGVPEGYYVVFENKANYIEFRRDHGLTALNWNREVTIKTGADQFDGWGMIPSAGHSELQVVTRLMNEYNAGLGDGKIGLTDVPGFTSAYFIDIPKVAQMIFNERTGQTAP
jgi:Fibronectin type III domain